MWLPQNVSHCELKGAYTGEVSASMLGDFGVKYCIYLVTLERVHFIAKTDDIAFLK